MATVGDDSRRMLGSFIRAQRQMANLSLRQLSALTQVSNPYLSQVERGLHEPSVRVLRSIADALDMSAETLLAQAGIRHTGETGEAPQPATPGERATADAIRTDPRLTESQRRALLSVYRSYVETNDPPTEPTP